MSSTLEKSIGQREPVLEGAWEIPSYLYLRSCMKKDPLGQPSIKGRPPNTVVPEGLPGLQPKGGQASRQYRQPGAPSTRPWQPREPVCGHEGGPWLSPSGAKVLTTAQGPQGVPAGALERDYPTKGVPSLSRTGGKLAAVSFAFPVLASQGSLMYLVGRPRMVLFHPRIR